MKFLNFNYLSYSIALSVTKVGEKLVRDNHCYLDKGYQGAKEDYPNLRFFIFSISLPKKTNFKTDYSIK